LRVAIMEFTPAATAPELSVLGAGLQSMITTDLGQLPAIVLVERARLQDIAKELQLGQSGLVDKQTAAKIGGLAGASHLLVGSFTVVGGKMRLDARLFAVASGEIVLSEKIDGAQSAFFELEKQLVVKLVDSVGVKLQRKQKIDLAKPATTDFEAFQKYSQGLVAFDEHKLEDAVAAMQAAVARDPNFTLAATKLAEYQALLPSLAKPPAPAAPQCRPNPMAPPACLPEPGATPPTPPPAPMMFAGDHEHYFGVVVRQSGLETRCVTPCLLHLPPGPVDLEVVSPVHFTRSLTMPSEPATVVVSGRNRLNLIIGSVLAGAGLAATAITIGLWEVGHNNSNTSTTPSSTAQTAGELWPFTFSLAAGLAYPSVHFLTQMGFNEARVVPFSATK
jgi:TolB-like protein